MPTTQQHNQPVSPAWLAVILGLAGGAALVTDQVVTPLVSWWAWPVLAVVGMCVTGVFTLLQQDGRDEQGWTRVFAYRSGIWIWLGVVTTLTSLYGWSLQMALLWAGGVAVLAAIGFVCPTPPLISRLQQVEPVIEQPGDDRRPQLVKDWEGHIRAVTKWKTVNVAKFEPWENPQDGFRLWVELPTDTGNTDGDLSDHCVRLGAAARLNAGCVVQSLPSDVQGVAILDVMLRDNLSDSDDVIHVEPTTAASINNPFPIITTPRGKKLSIVLRIETLLIGGATGSGKTTLLNRIIMYLARCTDTLLWIVDLNGGGIANNWIEPWARGKATKPVVDWVASTEDEFAVMVAVAAAIARDRKSNRAARERIRLANSGGVLPVDAGMAAIVVLADEGGEIRQALSAIGQIAASGLTTLAQIGRAAAVRPIISILRGTSDLMDKAHRTQCAMRLCLRMNEHGEYVHVLDSTPGKTPLKHKGAGYLKTTFELTEPVYGRTVNIDESSIERHAIACGDHRPNLDEYGLAVAAALRPDDVTGGKDYPTFTGSRAYQDTLAGKAYTGRWERAAALLAELRGEEYDDLDGQQPRRPVIANSPATSNLDAWAMSVAGPAVVEQPAPAARAAEQDQGGGARIYQFPTRVGQAVQRPAPQPKAPTSARAQILALVEAAGADGMKAADLERAVSAARSRVYTLLADLTQEGQLVKNSDGMYVAPSHAATTAG